jgi:lon-related putative ATP-dependent protease
MAAKKEKFINNENFDKSESNSPVELAPEQLRWTCPDKIFKFKTTASIEPLEEIIGQHRAMEAIRIGTELNSKGYNIFVSGLAGTGRLTTVKRILETMNVGKPVLFDYCYVNNFTKNDSPILIKLEKGKGKDFANSMDEAISYLRLRLPQLFEEDSFKKSRQKIIENYQLQERDVIKKFDEHIRPFGFVRGQIDNDKGYAQPEVFPLIDKEAITIDALNELVVSGKIKRKEADKLIANYAKFHNELFELGKKHIKLMQEFKKAISENDKSSATIIVNSALDNILTQFKNDNISSYINEAKKFILDNLKLFVQISNPMDEQTDQEAELRDSEKFSVFQVNVILDNSLYSKAPIIVETTPSYSNLFGTIDRTFDSRSGFWRTDFTKIKAGALLKADNGFLVVNALELFEEPGVWQALKRVLLYNKLEIQSYEASFQLSQVYIKPEPIEVNIKVIIIGGLTLYKALYEYEKGFKKIFKINAQFDYETKLQPELLQKYAQFISKICREDNLAHCTPSGVAAIIEWAVEQAGSQDKITLKFSDVADVIREAAFYDKYSAKKYIDREDVEKAISWRRRRNDLFDEKLRDSILEGTLLIDTSGERVGQINALTVMDDGLLSFGKPARITATVSAGSAGIINIEREAEMSGSIHNKGVLIITSFIKETFSRKKPVSLSATIAFEQNYGGIDGDSASAAEVFVLISAITGIPINQNFALTGSMNQKGDIQPIGGVNEKIRGYYEICKYRGLNGKQGVLIPQLNVKDLMLCPELIADIKKGLFHIYSFKRIEEGMELIMNMAAGIGDNKGNYPKDTVYRILSDKLDELSKANKDSEKVKNKKSTKKKNL